MLDALFNAMDAAISAINRGRRQFLVAWFLDWRTVTLVAAALAAVGSTNPWAKAVVTLPLGGHTASATFAVIFGVIAIAVLLYLRVAMPRGWRLMLIPLGCLAVIEVLALVDLVRTLQVAPDAEEEFYGLYDEVRPSGWLWITIGSAFVGMVWALGEIRHDRLWPRPE